MHPSYFLKQYQYDLWANQRTLTSLQNAATSPEKGRSLFTHIIAAQQIWLARINDEDWIQYPVWPNFSLSECPALLEGLFNGWEGFLNSASPESLERVVHYKNTAGKSYQTVAADILSHVIIHGGYHRGQIASLLRENGGTPAVTDYVAFAR